MLSAAVEELYRVYRDFPAGPDVEYCDHCLAPEDVEALRVTPVRELSDRQISLLLSNAPSTLGDATYIKHFVPRVLQLASAGEIRPIELMPALRWALDEPGSPQYAAIVGFLRAWWGDTLSRWPSTTSAHDVLDLVDDCGQALRPYLDAWSGRSGVTAARHVAAWLADYRHDEPEFNAWVVRGAASELLREALAQAPNDTDMTEALEIVGYLERTLGVN